mgnify:FL=1
MPILRKSLLLTGGLAALSLAALPLLHAPQAPDSPPPPAPQLANRLESVPPAAPEASPPINPLAYAPSRSLHEGLAPLPAPAPMVEPAFRAALAAYAQNDLTKGDEEAARVSDAHAKRALDWVALQKDRGAASLPRLMAFLNANPDWAARATLERRVEDLLFWDRGRTQVAALWFAKRAPQTATGRLTLARIELSQGKASAAQARIRAIWRQDDFSSAVEAQVLKDFADQISPEDHQARAIRLAYTGKASALRPAALAGEDVNALIKARLAVVNESASDALMQAVPEALRNHPLYLLSEAQRLRRKGEWDAAAKILQSAPRERAALVDPDEWWIERRLLARKLLDANRPDLAYQLAADHSAVGREQYIEAEFHAGWIALRFLKEPDKAMPHFTRAAERAETPISRARAAYWQGRAAEARKARNEARHFYQRAAQERTVYYGQLAREKLGLSHEPLQKGPEPAKADARIHATLAAEKLYEAGEREFAHTLLTETMRATQEGAQLAALADLAMRYGDARASTAIGKQALQRGLALELAAFPLSGIPAFAPAAESAPLALVHAIARQESMFHPRALSSAGAKGLMQMIDGTAQRTAKQIGVPFDKNKMLDEPAYNALLGAAHLGQLLNDYRGSHILTFVAYNAGPRRAKEWIAAYGDPREPGIDPVDWVERIPFAETRNYVQRVMENLEIYARLMNTPDKTRLQAELRTAEQKL